MRYYSVNFDWSKELKDNFENWKNLGRRSLEENCNHKTQDKNSSENNTETNIRYSGYCEECEVSEDDCQPMMSYAYPLVCEPSEEQILKVVKETCLTVMYKVNTDEYFLVLCGGGMDLSQSIGFAYLLIDGRIPKELISEISKQKSLSVSGKNWKFLRNSIIKELKQNKDTIKREIKEWEATEE